MATYWLGAGGNDANNGTTYALRKETTGAALALLTSKGDVLNIVGTVPMDAATYTIDGVSLGIGGTSFSDPAFTIQGTDSSGNAAMATLQASVTNAAFVSLANRVNYAIIKGIHFDLTTQPNSTTVRPIIVYGAGHTPIRIQSCIFEGDGTKSAVYHPKFPYATCSYNASQEAGKPKIEFLYCVFKYANSSTDNAQPVLWDHCVIEWFGTDLSGPPVFLQMNSSADRRWPGIEMVNCTIDVKQNFATPGSGRCFSFFFDYTADTATNTERRLHSNLICMDSTVTLDDTQFWNTGIIRNGVGSLAVTFAGTVGYNQFVFSDNITSVIAGTSIVDYYTDQYHPSHYGTVTGTEIYATDAIESGAVIEDIIAATSAWTWTDAGGLGYDIPLDKDYRVDNITMQTFAQDGGVVGAISQLTNVAPVAGPVTYAVTAGNVLTTTATDGVLSNTTDADLGDTLTATRVTSPSNGTIDTFNTTTGGFVYTPSEVFSGTDTFTFQAYDGTTYSNVSTITINVASFPTVPPGTADPIEAEYLDTAPFFRPALEVRTEFRVKSTKNRRKHHDLANYTEDHEWNESTHRVINVGTSTTVQATMGGVATAQYLIVETDYDIDVSINDTARYWSVSKCAAVALGEVTAIYLRNNSATNVAQVKLCVAD